MKRYYGKHPAKRDLKAHHTFMMLTKEPVEMKTILELTETETDTLKIIIASELKDANDREVHASAHACEFLDPHHAPILRIWEKINAG